MVESKTKQKILSERYIGPNLLLLTVIYLGLLIAGGSRLSAAIAIPHDSVEKAVAYMTKYGWTIQLGSFFELASAIPLGIFIATTIGRIRYLGIRNCRRAHRVPWWRRGNHDVGSFRSDQLVPYQTGNRGGRRRGGRSAVDQFRRCRSRFRRAARLLRCRCFTCSRPSQKPATLAYVVRHCHRHSMRACRVHCVEFQSRLLYSSGPLRQHRLDGRGISNASREHPRFNRRLGASFGSIVSTDSRTSSTATGASMKATTRRSETMSLGQRQAGRIRRKRKAGVFGLWAKPGPTQILGCFR